MIIYTIPIYVQYIIKNTLFLVDVGMGMESSLEYIVINSCSLFIILLLILGDILKKQNINSRRIASLVLGLLNIEMVFRDIHEISSLPLLVYIMITISQYEDVHKWHYFTKHSILIYFLVRTIIQYQDTLSITKLVTLIAWQPMNHWLFFSKEQIKLPQSASTLMLVENGHTQITHIKKQSQDTSKYEQTPQLGRGASEYDDQSSSLFSPSNIVQHIKQMKLELKNPFVEQNDQNTYSPQFSQMQKSTSNLDIPQIWNLLPFGIALMNNKYEVLTFNSKMLYYLKIQDSDSRNIISNLDSLLERYLIFYYLSAESLEVRSIYKASSHQSNRHSKKFLSKRQLSLISKYNNDKDSQLDGGTNTNINNGNYTYVANTAHQIRDEVLTSKTRFKNIEKIVKKFAMKSHSLNNNGDSSFQSTGQNIQILKIMQEIGTKKYYFRIKIYELDIAVEKVNYLFVIENITNKEELRILNIRYKFQQVLLNSLCHELRTPMNSTLSQLNALSFLISPQIRDKNLIPAIISAKKLMFQLNDILDYAQIDCKNFHLSNSQFELSEIFEIVSELFDQECREKNIILQILGNKNNTIISDKDRIIRILVNLIDNSIKFTNEGGRIIVSVQQIQNLVIFCVEDNGAGMSEKKINQIRNSKDMQMQDQFNFQKTKLGLGLRISQQIAKYLCIDKELIIESQENSYTKVTFKVESNQKNVNQQKFPSFQGCNFSVSCDCVKILNVDDVRFNHSAIEALLSQHKIKMQSAYNGTQAVQMVKDKLLQSCCKTYKLIFMDIEMPIKNGFQASSEVSIVSQFKITDILENENLNDQCVIVMCSAYNGLENGNKARYCGIREVLPKPIEQKSLKHLLDKYLL